MAQPLRTVSALVPSRLVEHPVTSIAAAAAVRTWEGHPASAGSVRVLPDGSADLVWDGRRLRVTGVGTGPVRHPVSAPSAGVRLAVGAAGRLLDCPADLLLPGGVDLRALLGDRAVDRWDRCLRDVPDLASACRVLEAFVADRVRHGGEPDGLVRHAVALLGAGHGVDDVARRVGLSARELRRRVHREAGPGPKALQRVLRFRGVLTRLGTTCPGGLADLAASSGYADQAHLTRECRALGGDTPTALAARWRRHEPGRNVQDRPVPSGARSSAWTP